MSKAISLKPVATEAPHPLAGKPVLESAPLRRGHRRSALSCFEDSTWDLSPAVFRENARVCHVTVHFDSITEASVECTAAEAATGSASAGADTSEHSSAWSFRRPDPGEAASER
jgi:hypothetical protein